MHIAPVLPPYQSRVRIGVCIDCLACLPDHVQSSLAQSCPVLYLSPTFACGPVYRYIHIFLFTYHPRSRVAQAKSCIFQLLITPVHGWHKLSLVYYSFLITHVRVWHKLRLVYPVYISPTYAFGCVGRTLSGKCVVWPRLYQCCVWM